MTNKNDKGNYVLAIESAIGEGSLALLNGNGWELAAKVGGVSRAEQILDGMEEILQSAGIDISEVNQIAVSVGPGSFTGIRIGISTALGLSKALDIGCVGFSAFEALATTLPDRDRSVVLPLGRNMYAVQNFSASPPKGGTTHEPEFVNENVLINLFQISGRYFLLHPSIPENSLRIAKFAEGKRNFVKCTSNIARLIGNAGVAGLGSKKLAPIYLRPRS